VPPTERRGLDRYRSRRDFAATPEPAGSGGDGTEAEARFVVHEHRARRLHWDLRLERDGVLVSWALPRGVPADPAHNRLAVHVEDHPLDYLGFAGEIPAGSYGAGTIAIWDAGTYESHKFRDDEVIVTFHGRRLTGRYALFRTRGEDWMIHRMDPPADPAYEPLPAAMRPMLARLGELPRDDAGWAYEIKWDGIRALLWADHGSVRVESRSGRDITGQYPELRDLGRALGAHEALLDGELVAYDEQGRPSFERLQQRMGLAPGAAVRRRMGDVPVAYAIFDLLHLDGHSTLALPYRDRRALLAKLALDGPAWQMPAHHAGDGAAMLAASRARGLEGIVAKRLDSPYEPGRRGGAWVKVKNQRGQELVVGGWLPGAGGRAATLGALLVGYFADGDLRYAGRVGSGLSEAALARLVEALAPLARDTSPFEGRQPPRGARFVEPRLVVEVAFTEWTRAGTLRHPVFKGLREDKDAREVVREDVAGA